MNAAKRAPVPNARIAVVCVALCMSACARSGAGSSDATPTPAPTLPVETGEYPAFGHAADFSWVAGRIVRSFAGDCTFVQYSTRRGEPWGGRIVLVSPSGGVELFPDGDMVVVSGALDSRALTGCGEPALVVRSIDEH